MQLLNYADGPVFKWNAVLRLNGIYYSMILLRFCYLSYTFCGRGREWQLQRVHLTYQFVWEIFYANENRLNDLVCIIR